MRKEAGFVVTDAELSLPDFQRRTFGGINLYHTSVDRYGQSVVLRENEEFVMVLVGSVFGDGVEALFERLCAKFSEAGDELNRCNGEFALVMIRKQTGEVLSACDKIGHQELYAKSWKGHVAFFPDLVLVRQMKPNRFSSLGISLFIKFRHPLPPTTFFEDVSILPGGCLWRARKPDEPIQHARYWKLEQKYSIQDENEYAPLLAEKIATSCRNRANRNLNPMFLSGGLDSASVLHGFLRSTNRMDAGFIVFPGYIVQERFADIAKRLADQSEIPFHRMDYSWSDKNAWENTLAGVSDVYSTYSTQAAFVRYMKEMPGDRGDDRAFFWGESADGLFGLNVTFEDDEDRYLGINRNMIRSAKFYAGQLAGGGFGRSVAQGLVGSTAWLGRRVPVPKITSRLGFLTGLMDRHLPFEDYMLGYYYNPAVLPGFSTNHLVHPLLTREGLDEQVEFFRGEYLAEAARHYAGGGIGAASKYLIFRMENTSIDIRMKRATGVVGLRPVFPLYDADVCEVIYSTPSRHFEFNRSQRPKHPLRVTAGRELGVPEWLLTERKAANYPNTADPEVESFKAIREGFLDYTKDRCFASHLDARVVHIAGMDPTRVSRFIDAVPLLVLEHLAREYM